MQKTLTAEDCLERACRLMLMADQAKDYDEILTYDGLAREWMELAARATRAQQPTVPAPPARAKSARPPVRRFKWHDFRTWFR